MFTYDMTTNYLVVESVMVVGGRRRRSRRNTGDVEQYRMSHYAYCELRLIKDGVSRTYNVRIYLRVYNIFIHCTYDIPVLVYIYTEFMVNIILSPTTKFVTKYEGFLNFRSRFSYTKTLGTVCVYSVSRVTTILSMINRYTCENIVPKI